MAGRPGSPAALPPCPVSTQLSAYASRVAAFPLYRPPLFSKCATALIEMAGTEFELPQAVMHRGVVRRHLESLGEVHARVGIAPHLQFVHRHVLHGRDKPRILFQHQPKLFDRRFVPARARKRNPQQIARPRIRRSLRHCVFENCNRFHGLPAADQLGRLIPNRRRRLPGKLHRPRDQPHKRDQNAPAHAVWNNTARQPSARFLHVSDVKILLTSTAC